MNKLALAGMVLGGMLGLGAAHAQYTGPKVNLTYVHGFLGSDRPYMEDLVKQFNASHPNIEVKYQGQDWGTTGQQLLPLVAAGRAPDVVAWLSWDITQFVDKGAFSELTPAELRAARVSKAAFYDKVWQGGQYQGKTYGVPLHLVTVVTFYNKDLMRKMGVSAPPRNREQFLAASARCTTDKAGRRPGAPGFDARNLATWGGAIPAAPGWFRLGITVAEQNGVDFLNAQGQPVYASARAAEALQFLRDTNTRYHVGPAGATEDSEAAAFRQGKSCFNYAGVWMLSQYREQLGDKLGVAPFPRLGTQRDASFGDASFLTLPRQRANYDPNKRAAALEFVGWMTGREQNLAFTKSGSLPTQPAVASDPAYRTNPMYGAFAGFRNISIYGGLGGTTRIAPVLSPFGDAVDQFLSGKKGDALQVLREAQVKTVQQIADAQK